MRPASETSRRPCGIPLKAAVMPFAMTDDDIHSLLLRLDKYASIH